MAIKIPWKALSKQDASSSKLGSFSTKQIGFFAVATLAVLAGLVLRFGDYFGAPEAEQKAPVATAAPPSPAPRATEPAASVAKAPPPAPPAAAPAPPPAPQAATAPHPPAAPSDQAGVPPGGTAAEQAALPSSGTILVSKRPVEVLAAPSATASAMYGFPAGRPFRVIGREGSFTQIQDVETGAKGWIDEAALALPPRAPGASTPSQGGSSPKATVAANPKAKAVKKDTDTSADTEAAAEPAPARKRGLFGGDGPFRGLFGGN